MSETEIPVALTIGDRVVARALVTREGLAHVAALLGLGAAAATPGPVYITGGPTPALPPGYRDRRVLEDACRSGALRATPVPRSGYRITHEDLAAWEATRRRKRRPAPVRASATPANDPTPTAVDADHELLAAAGGRRGRR